MEYEAFSSTSTQDLVPCGNCGRNFNPDALNRHAPICAKSSNKKRKVYDMAKHRSEGTDLAQFQQNNRFKGGGGARKPQPAKNEPAPKKSNWRQQHMDFINAIRSAKGVQKAIDTGGPLPPPPPPSINPDYIQCDYCGRRFNQQAHERHVKFCQEQHERLPNKKQPTAAAMQRANARTAYKVPRPKAKTVTSPPSSSYGQTSYGSSFTPTRTAGNTPMNRTAGPGSSARNRGGTGSMRGTTDHTDYGPSSGRALRTGRTTETYTEARELSAKQRSGMGTKSPAGYSGAGGYGGTTHTGPTRGSMNRHTDHGHHGNDSSDLHKQPTTRSGSGVARFCHECGSKYPMPTAKFCCECGIRRVNMT